MQAALTAAARGAGRTSPNPAVGAVVVKNGEIIATGWHRQAGKPHAEIEAIRALENPVLARGATLYVTLEPCSTHGRTPPCVEAILAHRFRRVVVGAVDPNPAHAGRGLELLREAGVRVTSGVLAEECTALNRAFNKWITTGLPWVIAKAGQSLDGRLTRPPGEGQWLTSERSRRVAMRLRAGVDAVLVGAGTVRADNPRLTLRGVRGRQPWRVVLSRSGELPGGAHLFQDEHRERTLVLRGPTLRAALRQLGKRGVTSVLIEGGGEVLGQAFDARLVNEAHFFLAPLLCGGPTVSVGGRGAKDTVSAARLVSPKIQRLGDDVYVSGLIGWAG